MHSDICPSGVGHTGCKFLSVAHSASYWSAHQISNQVLKHAQCMLWGGIELAVLRSAVKCFTTEPMGQCLRLQMCGNLNFFSFFFFFFFFFLLLLLLLLFIYSFIYCCSCKNEGNDLWQGTLFLAIDQCFVQMLKTMYLSLPVNVYFNELWCSYFKQIANTKLFWRCQTKWSLIVGYKSKANCYLFSLKLNTDHYNV